MNTPSKHLAAILVGFALTLGAGSGANADDTELFVSDGNPSLTGGQPNILFVIDTSGSMDTDVVTQMPWNPNTTWTGCYNSNYIYYGSGLAAGQPGCGTNNYLYKSANYCAASASGLASIQGRYAGQLYSWRAPYTSGRRSFQGSWGNFNTSDRSRPIECKEDRGVHGQTAGNWYASDGTAAAWANNTGREPVWGTNYTLFDGNWLNWKTGSGVVTQTRIEIVREVTNGLLDSMNGVNVGLMRFQNSEGGTVIHEIAPLVDTRATLKTQVDGLNASGWTPLSETMYEAGQYYSGRDVDYGNGTIKSVKESRTGGVLTSNTYQGPVNFSCQKNYIVLMTDGEPTQDVSADTKITNLPEFNTLVASSCDGSGDGKCLDDMAEYLYEHDIASTKEDLQNVTTYTVGFTADFPGLASTAKRGGGKYYLADDAGSLANTLSEIITAILDDATTFTSPSVPVNAFNRTTNLQDVYVSVFEPSNKYHWPGNLKKYRIKDGRLSDANGNMAVDDNTGFLAKDSQSFWSDSVDGDNVREGGAAAELPEWANRVIYTNLQSNTLTASADNLLKKGNSLVTTSMLGAPDTADVGELLDWLNGEDQLDVNDNGSSTDKRRQMGDPLHVQPLVVIYGGTSSSDLDAVVYTATNDGQFQAVNPLNGEELWSFMPRRMLSKTYDLYEDVQMGADKQYGLDGNISPAVLQTSTSLVGDDGVPGVGPDERMILVFGMRSGGNAYYALDVTDHTKGGTDKPEVLWEINASATSPDTAYAKLGETWSTPVLTNVKIGSTEKAVAIFGGGYDSGQEQSDYRTDSVGNGIYMVDLLTGALLWSAGPDAANSLRLTSMTHSIPADPAVIDLNLDGLADRIYVGDMGGRVWRFDIINGNPANTLVQGGVMASLGGAATAPTPLAADIRRFYNTPNVVPIEANGKVVLAINLGSGYRGHPRNTSTTDEFYSIRDPNVFTTLANDAPQYSTGIITRADLVDITDQLEPTLAAGAKGWRLRMEVSPGEKILTTSLSVNNEIFFVSFSPVAREDACNVAGGTNRLYRVNVTDGSPYEPPVCTDCTPEDPEKEDRYSQLDQTGIAPSPVLIFPEDQPDDPILLIGPEDEDPNITSTPERTFWTQDGS